jgi:crotonobetainyl-CoA:carnitine CoA-transferase CaiB-like acyl-CoA transferase
MWLTGHPDGPPLAPGAAVVPALEAAGRLAGALAGALGGSLAVDVPALLAGRAALLGLARQGRTSANGSCRLLPAADGWVAVNLPRPSDVESVPALVEAPVGGGDDPWAVLARGVAGTPAGAVVERATLLAVPAAALPAAPPAAGGPPFGVRAVGPSAGPGRRAADLLVVDLSAMWAGPVCARLLGRAGLRVVKVESTGRPDGARGGDARFYDWLHAGHESVALDLASERGRRALRDLVGRADVVIEASRPRALAQLGVDAEAMVAARPGVTWVGITGHGRWGAGADRVAFGDDAAVAAGLVARDAAGEPVFCGDAIADPITGLYAAVGALASAAAGGGHLLDVGMAGAARFAAGTPAEPVAAVPVAAVPAVPARPGAWAVPVAGGGRPVPVARPAVPPPPPSGPARPLGADTAAVLAELVPSAEGRAC